MSKELLQKMFKDYEQAMFINHLKLLGFEDDIFIEFIKCLFKSGVTTEQIINAVKIFAEQGR